MALNPPKCAVNMEQRLAALRHDQEIDGLRVYLIKYNLFPRNRDPHNSPIRIEELKELVKHWKLHRQRGFWRDHPEKEDLVRALLQHLKSEATNKKRRQEAQEKYNNRHKNAGLGATANGPGMEMSEAAKRDFSMILLGGKDREGDADDLTATGSPAKATFLKRRIGGDLFYQRGDYDEGMIYLSRIDPSRFQNEAENPRNELLTTTAASPTPIEHLVQMGTGNSSGVPTLRGGMPNHTLHAMNSSESTAVDSGPMSHVTTLEMTSAATSSHPLPTTTHLTREMKIKCLEGLYNVSCHRGFELQMLKEGALATIIQLLKTDDTLLRLYAATTLLNLTAPPHKPSQSLLAAVKDVYTKMMDDGVLGALLDLTHTPNASIKSFCARALFRFTIDETHHFRMVHEGSVVALTQLMTSVPNEEMRQACMQALVNLAAIPRAVTCDAILTTILALSKIGIERNDLALLQRCAQALLNLSLLPTTRANMIDEGALPALSVLTSTSTHWPILETMSCVLGNLAAIKTNQETMTKMGAMVILSELLRHVTRAFQELEAQEAAVDNVAQDDDGEVRAMVRAMLQRVRRNCAHVLAQWCCNSKVQLRVLSAGFVTTLLALIKRPLCPEDLTTKPLEEETEKLAVLALANLALEDRCRVAIVQDGAVPLLLGILQDDPGSEPTTRTHLTLLQLDCVTALSNLMLHPKNFNRMVDEGVVPALLVLIQHSTSPEIQRACVYAMLTLAKDPTMKTRLASITASDEIEDASSSPGAIPVMLVFASKQIQDSELCGVALSFLYHLSTRSENYEVLYFEGAVGFLMRVLQKKPEKGDAVAQQHTLYGLWRDALMALSQLANHPEKRATLIDDGALEAVNHVLRTLAKAAEAAVTRRRDRRLETDAVMLQFSCAQILCKLQPLCCASKSEIPAFCASLLLLAAQSSAKNSRLEKHALATQQKTVLRCALTIARATLMKRGLRLLAAQGDLPPALNAIMRTGLHEAQICAAIALCNLATQRSPPTTLKQYPLRLWKDATTEDFIVITLLRLNSDETKEICSKALFNLLTHDELRDQMVKDGVLYALIKLARIENEEMRDLALRAIYNLSLLPRTATQLLEMEIVRTLVKMYQAEWSKEMKRFLCGILSNLSSTVVGYDAQILSEGALSVLKHLLKVREPETRVYAANILYNLSCAGDVADTLVRDDANVLSLLSSALPSENRDVRRYAAMTIANLSGHALAIQLMTEQGSGNETTSNHGIVRVVHDVLKRTMASCLATSRACVLALRNLLTVGANQQRFIACGGITTLAAILACPEMESETSTLHVATDLLCALANLEEGDDGFEVRLVKDGMIKALLAIATGAMANNPDGSASTSVAERTVVMQIITSLSNLSKNAACHDLMLRDGVLETIALLARTSADTRSPFKGLTGVKGEEFCHHCMIALRNLVHQDEHSDDGPKDANDRNAIKAQRIGSQPSLVPMLLALSQSSVAETREHVVVTIHNVAMYKRCRMQLLKHDGVKALLRLGTSSTSAVKRHICGLALQLLSQQDASEDPHAASIAQDGLVAALNALAESQHAHNDVLMVAATAVRAVLAPRTKAKTEAETSLVAPEYKPMTQQGAAPDWNKVVILSMETWPALETLTTAIYSGQDEQDAHDEAYSDDDDDSDHEHSKHKDKASSPPKAAPLSPVNSRLRASSSILSTNTTGAASTTPSSSVTVPRTCSSDTVLGTLHLLEDLHLDKVKINLEVELAAMQRRGASRGTDGNGELPMLPRPATSEETERESLSLPVDFKSPKKRGVSSSSSTLSLVRHEANQSPQHAAGSGGSPIKSPISTPKRKSRTLVPLTSSASSPSL
ncbi:hypothetical protein Poli38472_013288 [Pythium oligandrum]|uniref:Vacuolar protein 8 n=1 Tax=Pythium oligandrum TaxID=41045 RepID=A0A8K1FDB7_PYTOL|nr:hypothetical protein Poli38472_013288 [Pythium oligandrum]|eukprot:TMW55397.1 hypothetical protein Poli38472_013288 [Pythium oligandrum]